MDGVTVPLAGYDGAVPPPAPRRSSACDPNTSASGPRAKACPRTIDIDEPMGSDSLFWMTLVGQQLSARTSADHGFTRGQPVRVRFDIPRASLFDRDSEQRL